MLPDDQAALWDMTDCCRRIVEMTNSANETTFRDEPLLYDAVQYRLIILGEAAKRLTPRFRETHDHIAWSDVAGLRDVLVHAYHRVDAGQVFRIATRDVPNLLAYIEPLLPEPPQ